MAGEESENRSKVQEETIAFQVVNLDFHFGVGQKDIWHLVPPEEDPAFLETLMQANREVRRRLASETPSLQRKVQAATQVIHEMFPSYNQVSALEDSGKERLPADLVFHYNGEENPYNHPVQNQILRRHTNITNSYLQSGEQIPLSILLPSAVCSTQAIILHMVLAQNGINSYVAHGRFIMGRLQENGEIPGMWDGSDHAIVWVPSDESKPYYNDAEGIFADPVCGFSVTSPNIGKQYKQLSMLSAKPGDPVSKDFGIFLGDQIVKPL